MTKNVSVPEGYKKTELGVIPEEWNTSNLEDVCEILDSRRLPVTKSKREKGNVPYYGATGIVDFVKDYIFDEELVLIGEDGADWSSFANTAYIIRGKSWVNNHAHVIRCTKINSVFFKEFINMSDLSIYVTGTTRGKLNQASLRKIEIPIPSLYEQQKIASILSKVDEQIEQTEQIIEKTGILKKGLMQKLLTKGIGHTKFKKMELGEIPEEWKIIKLKEICLSALSGGTPITSNEDYWNGDIPWMTSSHISNVFISSGQKSITKEGLDNSASKLIPKNNLIVATRVGLGKLAVNLIDISISQDLTGLIIDKNKADSLFFYWILKLSEKKIISHSQGTTIKGILKSDLLNLNVQLPPLDEQQKIASILSKVDSHIQDNQNYLTKLQELKKGLMQDLLTGKVRVCV